MTKELLVHLRGGHWYRCLIHFTYTYGTVHLHHVQHTSINFLKRQLHVLIMDINFLKRQLIMEFNSFSGVYPSPTESIDSSEVGRFDRSIQSYDYQWIHLINLHTAERERPSSCVARRSSPLALINLDSNCSIDVPRTSISIIGSHFSSTIFGTINVTVPVAHIIWFEFVGV